MGFSMNGKFASGAVEQEEAPWFALKLFFLFSLLHLQFLVFEFPFAFYLIFIDSLIVQSQLVLNASPCHSSSWYRGQKSLPAGIRCAMCSVLRLCMLHRHQMPACYFCKLQMRGMYYMYVKPLVFLTQQSIANT